MSVIIIHHGVDMFSKRTEQNTNKLYTRQQIQFLNDKRINLYYSQKNRRSGASIKYKSTRANAFVALLFSRLCSSVRLSRLTSCKKIGWVVLIFVALLQKSRNNKALARTTMNKTQFTVQ